MTKGGWRRDTVLFGKYRLLHTLGSGRTGTVWLAVHLGLEEYRAIKRVSKESADYDTFRREALVLKELRHPGIPMIYDLEEDSEYFYLIEEYLEGYSLYTLIMRQGPIQEAEAAQYGMQICGLVEYMHSACELPILYLDLQPNNLIICSGAVKLIDFDHAAGSRDANMSLKRYGTVGCAAPEQYTSDRMLDQRTDIYAIGAVLRFMITGTLREGSGHSAALSEAFGRIIRKCMEPDMEKRYLSVKEVESALSALCARKLADDEEHKAIPSHILIFTGMRPGAGTSHLAFGLVRYLTGQGYQVLYEEHNDSQAVRTMAARAGIRADRYGIYTMNRCCFKPWYGPAVRLEERPGFEVIVKDYGTGWHQAERELKQQRASLLAAGSAGPWEERSIRQYCSWLEKVQRDGYGAETALVFRGMDSGRRKVLKWSGCVSGRLKGIRIFGSPEYGDPFLQQAQEKEYFEAIWSAVSGCGGTRKGKKGWLRRWDVLKKALSGAAGPLRRSAGSSESRERDAGQG